MITNIRPNWHVTLMIGLIQGYQRYLSPYKGFACAHRVLHGGVSCSAYWRDRLEAEGLCAAWPQFRDRLRACKLAAQTLQAERQPQKQKRHWSEDCIDACCWSGEAWDCCESPELDCALPDCGSCDFS